MKKEDGPPTMEDVERMLNSKKITEVASKGTRFLNMLGKNKKYTVMDITLGIAHMIAKYLVTLEQRDPGMLDAGWDIMKLQVEHAIKKLVNKELN